MQQHGFAVRTHQSHSRVVTVLARFPRRSPADLPKDDLQADFDHPVRERGSSSAGRRLHRLAVQFLFLHVLGRMPFD